MNSEPDSKLPERTSSKPASEDALLHHGIREASEADLWDLDEEAENAVESTSPMPRLPEPKRADRAIIRHGLGGTAKLEKSKSSPTSSDVRLNVRSKAVEIKSEPSAGAERRLEEEFEELDDWEDVPVPEKASEVKPEEALEVPAPASRPSGVEALLEDVEVVAAVSPEPENTHREEAVASDESGVTRSVRQPLRAMEKIGLAALAVILLALAGVAYYWSIHQLPQDGHERGMVEFPQQGKLITLSGADSYWREPVLQGDDADRVRRGTSLIPVVELEVSGGAGALRIWFRDHDKQVVGDPVTRRVDGPGKLVVAATAGFDDVGMHAAYRTGQLDSWTVEVFEASSEDVAGKEFVRLFEMKLSSNLRKDVPR